MKRIATSVIGIPLVIAVIVYAPAWLFTAVVAAFAALAFDEFLCLVSIGNSAHPGRWMLALAVAVVAAFHLGLQWVVAAMAASVMVVMTSTVFTRSVESGLARMSSATSGLVYTAVLPGFLLMLPREATLVLFGLTWIGDSAAYYGGSAFGRRLLAPQISPKKTVEGAIFGLLGSLAAGLSMGWWLLGENPIGFSLVVILTSLAGQAGDLAESVLKRSAGVKDSSSILPGHGGILDRLDSLFFSAPVFYWLLLLL